MGKRAENGEIVKIIESVCENCIKINAKYHAELEAKSPCPA